MTRGTSGEYVPIPDPTRMVGMEERDNVYTPIHIFRPSIGEAALRIMCSMGQREGWPMKGAEQLMLAARAVQMAIVLRRELEECNQAPSGTPRALL